MHFEYQKKIFYKRFSDNGTFKLVIIHEKDENSKIINMNYYQFLIN